jgi:hypothetical protein
LIVRKAASSPFNLLLAGLVAIALPVCQPAIAATGSRTVLTSAPEIPQLTCTARGKSNGMEAKLTANRTKPGDPAYIEFRQRFSPSIPSGHTYVVFGRLDAKGEPVTRQCIGLFPKGSLVGLYGGAIVPMPADLAPSFEDCHFTPNAAYRVSLTEPQYQQLLEKVRANLANPPKWRMFGFNCNNFAATLGSVAGLVEPANRSQPSFSYIYAYIEANGDKERNVAG